MIGERNGSQMSSYSIELSDQAINLLNELAKEKGVDRGEILRRALASYAYLQRQQSESEGKKVSITQGKKILEEVELP